MEKMKEGSKNLVFSKYTQHTCLGLHTAERRYHQSVTVRGTLQP